LLIADEQYKFYAPNKLKLVPSVLLFDSCRAFSPTRTAPQTILKRFLLARTFVYSSLCIRNKTSQFPHKIINPTTLNYRIINNTMSGGRKMTPRGQMSRSANSGPAIMLIPPHLRATFVPNPPLKPLPPKKYKRKSAWNGMSNYMHLFETTPPPPREKKLTPKEAKQAKQAEKIKQHQKELEPKVEEYRKQQLESKGEYKGMNCYHTLFLGRLAYEVTERKLLREMESFGPVKDIQIVKDAETKKSKGYAFVEYENEEDMKRAYRAADGMMMENRHIVADVERGHTVPTWLPRRLGGGLGGTRCVFIGSVTFVVSLFEQGCLSYIFYFCYTTRNLKSYRLGGKDKNYTYPGRFDPSRPEANRPMPPMMGGGPPGMGRGMGGPPGGYPGGNYGPSGGGGYGGPPPAPPRGAGPPPPRAGGGPYGPAGGSYGGPPPPRGGDRYGGGGDRKRYRSRSPDRRHSSQSRRRY